MKSAKQWIKELNLQPHPEGGFYTQTDYSSQTFIKKDKELSLYTNIYFLLTDENPSRFHQLSSDEMWFYHAGNSLTVHSISPEGEYKKTALGLHAEKGEKLHHTVPAGTIFGSTVTEGYALVSCVVVPGFDFSDFRLFTKKELLDQYPEHHKIIHELAYDQLPE